MTTSHIQRAIDKLARAVIEAANRQDQHQLNCGGEYVLAFAQDVHEALTAWADHVSGETP